MTQNQFDSTVLCHCLLTSFILPSVYLSLTLLFVYILSIGRSKATFLANFTRAPDGIYQFVSSISPPCTDNGWKCFGVQDGCRIWCLNHSGDSQTTGDTFHSISFLAHTSINNLVCVFLDPKEILEWNYLFSLNPQVLLLFFSIITLLISTSIYRIVRVDIIQRPFIQFTCILLHFEHKVNCIHYG